MADVTDALDLLGSLRRGRNGGDEFLISFIHEGDPASKARARFNFKTKRTYTPQRTMSAENSLAWQFREATGGVTREGNIAIVAIFYRSNHQRIDADNLMKLVMDSATKAAVWKDDSQVTAQAAVIEYDADYPRTVIAMGPTESSLKRGAFLAQCPRCSKSFEKQSFSQDRKYCSRACAQPRSMARCAKCEIDFRRRSAGQRYCSRRCAKSEPRPKSRRVPRLCEACGGPVSRREYKRCSRCAPKGRRIGSKNKPKIGVEIDVA